MPKYSHLRLPHQSALKFNSMRVSLLTGALAMVVLLGAGCTDTPSSSTTASTQDSSIQSSVSNSTWSFPGTLPAEQINSKQIRLTTNKGDIVFKLYDDTAPNTVSNFVYLASMGYYDGLIFHRVINGFMIQGGDPTGTGSGGPGYKFADELNDDHTYVRGTVAMANAGPNTNGSQFFIMHKDTPLPHAYSIFGEVIEGMDVVDAIATTKTGAGDRPVTEVVMTKVTVEDAK